MRYHMISAAAFLLLFGSGNLNATPSDIQVFPTAFECGEYEIQGRLTVRGSVTDVLLVHPGTTNQIEIVLRKMDSMDTVNYSNKLVRMRVLFRNANPGTGLSAEVLQMKGLTTTKASIDQPVQLLKRLPCGKSD